MTAILSKDDDKKSLTFFKFCDVSLKLSKTFLQQNVAFLAFAINNLFSAFGSAYAGSIVLVKFTEVLFCLNSL